MRRNEREHRLNQSFHVLHRMSRAGMSSIRYRPACKSGTSGAGSVARSERFLPIRVLMSVVDRPKPGGPFDARVPGGSSEWLK